MAVGLSTNVSVSQLNADLGNVAVELRDSCKRAIEFFQGVNSIGIAGLEQLGMTVQDANDLFSAANELQTVAQVYFGTAAQAAPFNFDSALAEARGTK